MPTKARIWVCDNDQLEENNYVQIEVAYASEPSSVVVFRYKGKCLAYRNRCAHMQQRLDCKKDTIFDDTGQNLRCSMHGATYDPITGESMSAICKGERLTPIRVQENEEGVWITDKRVKPLAGISK